jgi:transcriptional regulator of acetoin/glycerol metabolism
MADYHESVALLARLGAQRARLQEEQEALNEEIRQALVATDGEISKVEAAQLLGIDRTTLYRTYLSK